MIRTFIAAAVALTCAVPTAAQSQQDQLEARYDRALAAGYKALFLCSAIANAERAGATRTPESVMEWELTGIQAPLDEIVRELRHEIERARDGLVSYTSVQFADSLPPRFAIHKEGSGCSLQPIGTLPIRVWAQTDVSAGTREFFDEGNASGPTRENESIVGSIAAVDAAFSGYGEGTRTTAVVVLQDDKMVSESYTKGFGPLTPQRTWSVAKSIAATLVGAGVQRGDIATDHRAGISRWADDARGEITIDNLLRMASGRYSDTPGNRTDPLYFGGSTVDETALHWPLIHEPGTVYRYANNDTLAAIEAISPTFAEHPPAELFATLGMDATVAETDWQGNYILSSQVWSTARDLAQFGQLYLDDGLLPSGERILPEGWVDYVSSPSGPQPDGPFGYGAGFWLFNNSEGVPPDTFAAMGNRGQYVVIVPSRDVVIVRRGEDPAGTRFDIAAFTRDVLAALE